MKKIVFAMIFGVVSLSCLAACGKTDVAVEDPNVEEASPSLTEPAQTEKPERLNTAKFENLSIAAEQVGYSFRASQNLTSDETKFTNFSISEPVQEINGMELAEPYPVVRIHYKIDGHKLDVTIFPYEGENILPATYAPICYVSTKEMNEIDVNLAEYIIHLVPEDYEMTEEDWEFHDSGKGSFSCDLESEGDDYYRSMYWVQDGIYYEICYWAGNTPVEDMEALVNEYMNADMQ